MHTLIFDQADLLITRAVDKKHSLSISYKDCSLNVIKAVPKSNSMQFSCLIGLKYVEEIPILIVGVDAIECLKIESAVIYQIKKVAFVAVAPEKQQQNLLKSIAQPLQAIQMLFQLGFHYFSDNYDLSVPYITNKVEVPQVCQRKYYDQFVWNYNLAHFDGQKVDSQSKTFWNWCDKIIQGYICHYECQLPVDKINLIVISRRSYKKAGTRFYARGIDDQGNVANFTQTEQIIFLGDYIFSHLQIRGSVPAFFSQVGINGIAHETVIERNEELTKNAFRRHFSTLRQIYGRIFAVNLLSQKKSQEKLLSTFFQQMVSHDSQKMPFLKYHFYDFHEQCKNNKFQNSNTLIESLNNVIEAMGYNCYQVKTSKLVARQKGVFRTNCLDCLDRTNYIQSRVGLRIVKHFIERFSREEIHSLCKEKRLLDLPVNDLYPLLRGFNELWADNGDAISLLYTGIGSTHTDITRTGERTLLGAINHKFRSLMRFYAQFNDHIKHETINKLVTPSPFIKARHSIATNFHTTLLISYDNQIPLEQALQKLKNYICKTKPTIVVIFVFQKKEETFFDKLSCFINNKTADFNVWEKVVSEQCEEEEYARVGRLMGTGCWMGVFCQKDVVRHVAEVKSQNLTSEITAGEAMLLKLKLQSSSFIFAGVNIKNFSEYLSVFDELHEKGFQIRKLGQFKSSSFFDLDYKVVIGNTGSSIYIPQAELQLLTEQYYSNMEKSSSKQANSILHKILDHDEFGQEQLRNKSKYLRQYSEGPLSFLPSSNRVVFWNQQSVVLRVRQYGDIGKGAIVCVLDYQIGVSGRSSLVQEL